MIFTTPRETIRLTTKDSQIRVTTSNTNVDVTDKLENISQELVDDIQEKQLCGFIFKSKSPTCGMSRVKIYPEKRGGQSENSGVGIFANKVMQKHPLLPTEEEGRLNDAWLRENFLMQIFAYKHMYKFLDTNPSFNELVAFHTSYKYLIYAKSHEAYKELGHIVANHDKKDLEVVLNQYKYCFLKAISKRGTISNTYNVVLHIYGYFKKLITTEEKEELLEAFQEFKDEIIPFIAIIKLLNLYTKRFNIEYLKSQKFLNPYPKELALRSTVLAYK